MNPELFLRFALEHQAELRREREAERQARLAQAVQVVAQSDLRAAVVRPRSAASSSTSCLTC